jgi:hypothetical protein
MSDYDADEYEYQELLAERRQEKRNSRYFAQGDPEAPDAEEEPLHYLTADTAHGVVFHNSHDGVPEYLILGDMDFYEALDDVQDDEVIYGAVNSEVFDQIRREYGVAGVIL